MLDGGVGDLGLNPPAGQCGRAGLLGLGQDVVNPLLFREPFAADEAVVSLS